MTRHVSPLRKALIGGMVLLGAQACQDVSITAVDVASLEVTPSEGSLRSGETLQLAVTLRDADGNVLQERPVAWSTEDGSVAGVASDGLVEARSPGETRIRASSGGAEAVADITVRAALVLQASPTELRFESDAGEGSSDYQSVSLTAGGGDTVSGLGLSVHYADGQPQGWLDAELQGSQTPATLRVRASARDLQEGMYEAEIRVGSQTVQGTANVRVVLVVDAPAPSIRLSTATVTFERVTGQPAPSPQTVEVTNDGGGQLTGLQTSVQYASGQPSGWLSASLASSTAPAALALSVASSSPPPGTYEATVRVTSPVAENSPRTLTVVLQVGQASVSTSRSEVSASPGEIRADGESTSTITVQLRDAGGDAVAPSGASVTVATTRGTLGSVSSQGGGRYTATLTSSTSPGDAVVTARVNGSALADDATVRFTPVQEPPSSSMRVASIDLETHGGQFSDRHLRVTLRVVDGAGNPVSGANVEIRVVHLETTAFLERSGTTGGDGRVVLGTPNIPVGCFRVSVERVQASGLEWDGVTPNNQLCKN